MVPSAVRPTIVDQEDEGHEGDPRSRRIIALVNDSGGRARSSPDSRTFRQPFTLRNAHLSGARAWSKERKRDYANELTHSEHLIAVYGPVNGSKGAKGPDVWKPPDQDYWCQYATDWEAIKTRWGLSMTVAEAAAAADMKGTCGPN